MGRPDASAERMVSVTKRYGLSVVLVLSALLVTLLVRPETLVGPVFLLAVLLSAWLGGMGPGLVAARLATLTIDYFFLPPKYTLRFNPAELPELLVYFVSADLSQFAVITDLEIKAKQAIEAYVSLGPSPLTALHALQAMRLVSANLEKSLAEALDPEYRTNIMRGSFAAGFAFSNASVGAVHAMSNDALC